MASPFDDVWKALNILREQLAAERQYTEMLAQLVAQHELHLQGQPGYEKRVEVVFHPEQKPN